jgi:alkanesulfonate monooxygenase SsuD/methylene tetrahydromethanopterin reductase-like flavin-dependent oxidoreductase (luciferase family)
MDHLEESLQVVRSLLREPSTTFKGRYHQLDGAVCGPKPVNPNLRIWVGGRGPLRTPRIAARYADGFNAPYLAPELFAERMQTLDRFCEEEGRDPASIERSVNVGFFMSPDAKSAQKPSPQAQAFAAANSGGGLMGSPAEAIDTIGAYEKAGAQGLNIAFRPPIDWDAFEAFIADVLPAFHS